MSGGFFMKVEDDEIDAVEMDFEGNENFKTKANSRCKDPFLNTLCDEHLNFRQEMPNLDEEIGSLFDDEGDNMDKGHEKDEELGIGVVQLPYV
ncbi:hypothetical protein L1887_28701 [Cichorium endivia]|nr:hypothetical protein L1887_28701 [Cichorium endivia]